MGSQVMLDVLSITFGSEHGSELSCPRTLLQGRVKPPWGSHMQGGGRQEGGQPGRRAAICREEAGRHSNSICGAVGWVGGRSEGAVGRSGVLPGVMHMVLPDVLHAALPACTTNVLFGIFIAHDPCVLPVVLYDVMYCTW